MPDADFYGEWFFVPKGKTPHLLGEPVALLIYKDFDRFDAAKRWIQFDDVVVRYGAVTAPNPPPNYGAARYVRIQGATSDAPDEYSPIKDTIIFVGFKGEQPQWPAPSVTGDPMARGMAAAARIERDFAAAGDDALILRRSCSSQSIDLSAMEPANGNVWYDAATHTLSMIMATQSPFEMAQHAAQMLSKSRLLTKKVDLKCGYTVGYGTKDQAVSVLRRPRRTLRRGPAGAPRQRPFRAIPDGDEASRVLDEIRGSTHGAPIAWALSSSSANALQA